MIVKFKFHTNTIKFKYWLLCLVLLDTKFKALQSYVSIEKAPATSDKSQVSNNARDATAARHDTTSSNQHLQIHEAFPRRFRGGRKIKKFVEESRLIPVAFMVMPGCVYSTIQFIFFPFALFLSLRNYLSFVFRFALYCIRDSMFANKVRLCLKISQITAADWLCSRLQRSFLSSGILCV